jgi:altronate dehydratase large subunit
MDIDLSAAIDGTKTIQELGKKMLKDIEEICNGRLTKAEAYGFSDIAVDHVCRFV